MKFSFSQVKAVVLMYNSEIKGSFDVIKPALVDEILSLTNDESTPFYLVNSSGECGEEPDSKVQVTQDMAS